MPYKAVSFSEFLPLVSRDETGPTFLGNTVRAPEAVPNVMDGGNLLLRTRLTQS